MLTEIEVASDLRVNYIRRDQGSREETESIEVEHEVEVLEEKHDDVTSQQTESHSEKKLPGVKRSSFRVFTVSLVVLYLLILAGIIVRYLHVIFDKEQLNIMHEELQIRYNQSQNHIKQLQGEMSGRLCPEGWTRFGCSCYFKSSENQSWPQSRAACQDRGSDLVIINSKEEQEFVTKLNIHGLFWIGLKTNWTSTGFIWEWVDGSRLTQTFWVTGRLEDPEDWYYATCCDQQRKWTRSRFYDNQSRTWICERKIY